MLSMILCVMLFPFLFLMGRAAIKLLYRSGKRTSLFWEDQFLTGAVLLIGLAEAAHIGAMASGRSVSAAVRLFVLLAAGMAAACGVILAVCRIRERRAGKNAVPKGKARAGEHGPGGRNAGTDDPEGRQAAGGSFSKKAEVSVRICLGILTAVLLFRILAGCSVYLKEDLTLETVMTFLKTDRIYEIDPLTGIPYQAGLPSRLKILCLPTFYAVLCRITSLPTQLLVWKAVPLFVLAGAVLAYRCLAKSLFPDCRLKRELFLALVLLLFLVGDTVYGTEGFGLLYAGFQGSSLRSAVLIPYLFSLCLRKRWRLAPGPILAEACIVWTLYGLGAGAAVLGIFGAAEVFCRIRAGRKEGPEWENS